MATAAVQRVAGLSAVVACAVTDPIQVLSKVRVCSAHAVTELLLPTTADSSRYRRCLYRTACRCASVRACESCR